MDEKDWILMICAKNRILKALNDGIKGIDVIQVQKGVEINLLLATLPEWDLTGTVENVGGQIKSLAVELKLPSN